MLLKRLIVFIFSDRKVETSNMLEMSELKLHKKSRGFPYWEHGYPWPAGRYSGKAVFGELVPESGDFHVQNSRGKSFVAFGFVQSILQKLPFGMLDS